MSQLYTNAMAKIDNSPRLRSHKREILDLRGWESENIHLQWIKDASEEYILSVLANPRGRNGVWKPTL